MHLSKTIKLKDIGFVELLSASFVKQSFNKHFHEEFCFGVVEWGQLDFNYRGKKVHAYKGMINLCNPGEIHDGFTKKGWAYKMFYVDAKLMKSISSEISGKNNDIPFFKEGVIEDQILGKQLIDLHELMCDERVFLIEKDKEVKDIKILLKGLKLVNDYLDKTILKPNNINFPNNRLLFLNTLR